jgi:acetate kinase
MLKNILTINTGSATIKFSVFTQKNNELIALHKAEANKLDQTAQLSITSDDNQTKNNQTSKINLDTSNSSTETFYSAAISAFLDWLENQKIHINAVSHRVVHGGKYFSAPIIIDDDNLKLLATLNPLAPLHQPYNLQGITQARERLPECPHIACFDTAFHHCNPEINRYYAIPRSWEAEGIRRYGFHGLSYAYIQLQLEKMAPEMAQQKMIFAHLGQGASLCALNQGKSVLTSMGLTALDGLVMGTRCGTIDPGVLLYWMDAKKLSYNDISDILYKQSGLLGLSEISCDMRTLLENKTPAAQLAIDIFVQRICQYIGMLTAELEGLAGLVFTAGIGEKAAAVRLAICEKLQWLGVNIDETANQSGQLQISSHNSKVVVYVIPTNEEYMLARYAEQLCERVID